MVELERFDELFDVPLHREVTVDDLLVDIAQEGPFGEAIEEQRTSSQKGLVIPIELARHPQPELRKELPLPAHPLQKRARLQSVPFRGRTRLCGE